MEIKKYSLYTIRAELSDWSGYGTLFTKLENFRFFFHSSNCKSVSSPTDSFFVAPIVCGDLMLGSCSVVHYFVYLLVLQSSHLGRESWLLYFVEFRMSYLCYHFCLFLMVPWFTCSVLLWHFQVIQTYCLIKKLSKLFITNDVGQHFKIHNLDKINKYLMSYL